MSVWIKQFASSPIFNDEDKTRTAGLLNIMLLVLLAAGPLTSIAMAYIEPENATRSVVLALVLALIFLGLRDLNRRGRVRLTGTLLSAILWLR
jgi:hypothetical protein